MHSRIGTAVVTGVSTLLVLSILWTFGDTPFRIDALSIDQYQSSGTEAAVPVLIATDHALAVAHSRALISKGPLLSFHASYFGALIPGDALIINPNNVGITVAEATFFTTNSNSRTQRLVATLPTTPLTELIGLANWATGTKGVLW